MTAGASIRGGARGARMRGRIGALLAAAALAGVAPALLAPQPTPPTRATPAPPATPAAPAARAAPAAAVADPAPAAGGLVVPAGTRTATDVVVVVGGVDVRGTVAGDVVAVSGDVTVYPGGHVTGDVVSVFGRARNLGGRIDGDVQSYARAGPDGARAGTTAVAARPASVWHSLQVTLGWFAILLILGVGVLVSASPYLDGVALALEEPGGILRALATGIAGQLLLLPALLVVVLGLAITVIGILAIPLAVVALVVAVAGLVTLGFLAVAFVTGRALGGHGGGTGRWRAAAARGEAVRALTIGLAALLALWFVAALLAGTPTVALLVRSAALGLTWVAATAGFGAALLSRAGTAQLRRPARREPDLAPVDRGGVPVWQTPTPITGIVAARRQTVGAPPVE